METVGYTIVIPSNCKTRIGWKEYKKDKEERTEVGDILGVDVGRDGIILVQEPEVWSRE